jgi:hypothetical protein
VPYRLGTLPQRPREQLRRGDQVPALVRRPGALDTPPPLVAPPDRKAARDAVVTVAIVPPPGSIGPTRVMVTPMRLPVIDHDHECGPMLELRHIQRQLHLGAPIDEGIETIAVAHIVGSAGRARDFDGAFHPVHRALQKRIDEIRAASPTAMDEPIEAVRIDRAYFVSDGHKRVAIAKRDGREFIDARVSHMPSRYAFTPDVEADAIERTAREGEFRRHSGTADGVPDARFALTNVTAYGELLVAVQSYAYDRVLALGRALPAAEAARMWYEHKYLPAVAEGPGAPRAPPAARARRRAARRRMTPT